MKRTINEIAQETVNEMNQIDLFTGEMKGEDSVEYTLYGVKENITDWFYNKEHLYDILSTHPDWDEEHLWIRKDVPIKVQTDTVKAIHALNSMENIFYRVYRNEDDVHYNITNIIIYGIISSFENGKYVDDAHIEYRYFPLPERLEHLMVEWEEYFNTYNNVLSKKLTNGEIDNCEFENLKKDFSSLHLRGDNATKKALNKVLDYIVPDAVKKYKEEITINTEEGEIKRMVCPYEKEKAKLMDAFVCKTETHTLTLSINPIDYLTMSRGNTWCSCYNISNDIKGLYSDGCYKAGTLSYMTDFVTAIMYRAHSMNSAPIDTKINRTVFFINDADRCFVQERMYPQTWDKDPQAEETRKQYREWVESVLENCNCNFANTEEETTEPKWTKLNHRNKSRIEIFAHDDFLGYKDWTHFPNDIVFKKKYYEESVNANSEIEFEIGSTCYCLSCGNKLWEDNKLICQDCYNEYDCCCESCGEYGNEDDMTYIEGYGYVCDYCCHHNRNINYDDYIEEWVYDESGFVDIGNRNMTVAFSTIANNSDAFFCCDTCDTYYYIEDDSNYHYVEYEQLNYNHTRIWHEERTICDECYYHDTLELVIPNPETGEYERDENGYYTNIVEMTLAEYEETYRNN